MIARTITALHGTSLIHVLLMLKYRDIISLPVGSFLKERAKGEDGYYVVTVHMILQPTNRRSTDRRSALPIIIQSMKLISWNAWRIAARHPVASVLVDGR
jgi:hypothetical protein